MSFYSSSEKNDFYNIFPKKEDLSEYEKNKKLWNKLMNNKNSFNSISDIFSSEDENKSENKISENFYKIKKKRENLETSFDITPNFKKSKNLEKTADKNEANLFNSEKNVFINPDIIKPENQIKKLNLIKKLKEIENSSHKSENSQQSEKSYSNSFQSFKKIKKNKKIKKQITCKCKKTKCLKLYCDCFASENECSKNCKCQNCYNLKKYSKVRKIVIKELLQQNPLAFENKYKEINKNKIKIHLRGCACKNSKCIKNYCECFLVNVKCTDLCRCLNCCNLNDFLGDEVKDFKIVVKRKRKKKEFLLDGVKNKLKEYKIMEDVVKKESH